jgi:hypothetical protein
MNSSSSSHHHHTILEIHSFMQLSYFDLSLMKGRVFKGQDWNIHLALTALEVGMDHFMLTRKFSMRKRVSPISPELEALGPSQDVFMIWQDSGRYGTGSTWCCVQ